MSLDLSSIIFLFQPLAVTITLVYAFGFFARRIDRRIWRDLTMGALFGLAAALSMEMPLEIADGVIIDLRNLFVGLAAGLFGWVTGLIALVFGIVTRLNIGGVGATSGIIAMSVASSIAMLWHYQIRSRITNPVVGFAILGICVSGHLSAVIVLPPDIGIPFLTDMGPTFLLLNIGGSILLGVMFMRENLLINETERLREDARTDPLTHLMNRRYLEEAFAALDSNFIAEDGRALLYFDLDDFKSINDTYGHKAGDVVLRAVCTRVATCLRGNDLFSRLGGDEFVVVLPNVTPQTACDIAERCRAAVAREPIVTEDAIIAITISIGVHWTQSAPAFHNDLAQADEALYTAKKRGRDRVSLAVKTAAA